MAAPAYIEVLTSASRYVPRGQRFALVDGAHVGRASECAILLYVDTVARRHARFTWHAADERWHIEDMGSTGGTWRNASKVREAALEDGDVVMVGTVRLLVKYGEPVTPIAGVDVRGRWVTFNAHGRHLAYAMAADDDEVRVAGDQRLQFMRYAADEPRHASPVAVVDEEHVILEDIAGLGLADVAAATASQRATLDMRPALAAASLLIHVGRSASLDDGTLLTWRGDVVVGSPPFFAGPESLFWQDVIIDVLALAGIRRRSVTSPGLALDEPLLAVDVSPALRAALDDLARAPMAKQNVDDQPRDRFLALLEVALEAAGGPPSRDDVRGLLLNLFPERAALDRRIREDAGVLGHDGIAKLALPASR